MPPRFEHFVVCRWLLLALLALGAFVLGLGGLLLVKGGDGRSHSLRSRGARFPVVSGRLTNRDVIQVERMGGRWRPRRGDPAVVAVGVALGPGAVGIVAVGVADTVFAIGATEELAFKPEPLRGSEVRSLVRCRARRLRPQLSQRHHDQQRAAQSPDSLLLVHHRLPSSSVLVSARRLY